MRRSACFVSVAVVSGVLLFSTADANAQPADGVAPAPGAGGAPPPPKEEEHDGNRLRIGFNINGGLGTNSALSGPTFGGTFRIGWQFTELLAVYGNISPFVWAASSSLNVPGVSVSAAAGVQTAPMLSLTPIDLVEIAAGPSIDYLGAATSSTAGGGSASGSVDIGIHGRLALHLGGRNPDTGRRRGFTIGGDVHPTFTSGSVTTFFTLGLGADWY